MKKTMKKYNFVKVITFISILILFSAQSVYDPSVHARMNKIEDESLDDIDAAALDLDMILTVRSVVTSGLSFKQNETATASSINIGYMEIGNANLVAGSSFQTNTSMAWDIGNPASLTQTWLRGGNVFFPVIDPGMGVNMTNVFLVRGSTASTLPIGNVTIKGIVNGQNIVGGTPNLDPFVGSSFTSPWVIISSLNNATDKQGLKFYGEQTGYINEIALNWRVAGANNATAVIARGLYIYGMMNETSGFSTPTTWPKRQGMMKMGGSYPTYNVTTGSPTGASGTVFTDIEVGTSGAGKYSSKVFVNLPFSGSIRIKDVNFGTANWGPFCIDDASFYINKVYMREL